MLTSLPRNWAAAAKSLSALAIAAAVTTGSQYSAAAASRDGAAMAQDCQSCHGPQGISVQSLVPTIAGQKEGYLALQLIRFRYAFQRQFGDPRTYRDRPMPSRKNLFMDHIAGIKSNADIQVLAMYYSGLSCRQSLPPNKMDRPIIAPYCDHCHGNDGVSTADVIPTLAGQKANYLVLQSGAFRQSNVAEPPPFDFPKRSHPVMSEAAEHISNEEIRTLGTWYASRNCR